jgi:hypothetical protein
MQVDRQSGTDLVVDYWYDVDHNGGKGAHLFYLADGEFLIDAAVIRGQGEIEAMYTARRNRGPRLSRHLAANIRLTRLSEGRAEVQSVLCLFAEDGEVPGQNLVPATVADVVDDVVVVEGRLLIARRRLTTVFLASGTELAVPTS